MFKNKLKELVQNKKEITNSSFEILNDDESLELFGGCRVLKSCGSYEGSCNNLQTCNRYNVAQ